MKCHISNWYSFPVCIKCCNVLTDYQKMYLNGTCPYCGNTSKSTVIDYKKITIRKYTYYRYFKILPLNQCYQGKNDESHTWLLNNIDISQIIPYDKN